MTRTSGRSRQLQGSSCAARPLDVATRACYSGARRWRIRATGTSNGSNWDPYAHSQAASREGRKETHRSLPRSGRLQTPGPAPAPACRILAGKHTAQELPAGCCHWHVPLLYVLTWWSQHTTTPSLAASVVRSSKVVNRVGARGSAASGEK
jgi:hypothetical protein